MTSTKLAEPRSFSGQLSLGDETLPVTVSIGIDSSGELEFDFALIPLTNQSKFILIKWDDDKGWVVHFSLSASAEDGTRFDTDDLHFSSVGTNSGASGTCLTLTANCSKGILRFKLAEPAVRPALRMRLRGFENLGSLHGECQLGQVALQGQHSFDDFNAVTGSVLIQAADLPANVLDWRVEAEKLLQHIRRVMSLAASSVLRAPLIEYFYGDELEVTIWSETRQHSTGVRLVHFLAQEAIFQTAIRSFFKPPIKVKQLFFAIEWFAMEATYNEIRLVGAMTALENLIDSNLERDEALILPRVQFDKIRRVLLSVIRTCLSKWSSEKAEDASVEINEKLLDLNRRSLLRKLELLARRWNVPLDGISPEGMRAAKQARDKVVHRGQYYEDAKETDADLWTHFTIVREIAVRFLFTVIGYEGRYISHVGGYHDATFPPPKKP
jgi:hypothetical protein